MRTHPALVLNADFQPLSYFPLSLLRWDRAVKAVVEATHSVVEEYDTVVRSPSTVMRLPSVLALRKYHPVPKHVAFTRFNVFLRDRFRCQYCGERARERRSHVRPCDPEVPRRPDLLGQRGRGLPDVQRAQGQLDGHEAAAPAAGADIARAPGGEAGIPAELPARDLARLSVLGRRARAVKWPAARADVPPAPVT